MAKSSVAISLVLLFLVAAAAATRESEGSASRRHREEGHQRFRDLKPRNPKQIFRSDGGSIEEWHPSDYPALCDADVGARRLRLEQNGLAVPSYINAPVLKIITKGSAKAGIINPLTDQVLERNIVFHVKKGDVIALPRGVACWLYNDAKETTEVLEIADTKNTAQCGRFNAFLLAGGKQRDYGGSILQGFSTDMIAHAWDVEERTIQQMFEGQKETAIIKVDERKMHVPELSANTLFMDFVYRFQDSEPDVRVRDAGELKLLSSLKLPVLKQMGMAAGCVKMQEGALTAPGWIHNSHMAMYVDGGRGRVQIVRENGERALDTEVEEGNLLIIPENFPCVKLAGEQGFRYAAALTNDRPVESFLAGRNSVYQGMPRQVVSSAFQIDDRLLQQLAKTRTEEAYLFPPRRQQQKRQEQEQEQQHHDSVLETVVHDF